MHCSSRVANRFRNNMLMTVLCTALTVMYLSDGRKARKRVIDILLRNRFATRCALWAAMHTRLGYSVLTYCTVHKFICICVGALSKWLRKALPISEKQKLALLEFRYFSIISKLALLEFRYFDLILKFAWLEFQYFGIQKITENNFSISVYRYSQPWYIYMFC